MTDPVPAVRPSPRWLHAWAVLTAAATLALLVLGQLVTSFRAGMADPIWPTEPWYVFYTASPQEREKYKIDFGYGIEHTHRYVAFGVGGLVSVLALGLWASYPPRSVGRFGLGCLAVLLVGFVLFHHDLRAQRDSPTLTIPAGSLAVMMAALLALVAPGTTLVVRRERGTGLRLLGVVALVGVMVQGLFGGFRVKFHALAGPELAAVHGVFGQVVFALLVAVAVLTGPARTRDLPAESRETIGWPAVMLVGLAFVQLVWGAMVRHDLAPLAQRMHMLTAFLVVALAVYVLRLLFADPAARPRLSAAGWHLAALLAVQVALGVEAWMMKFGTVPPPETPAFLKQSALVRTVHSLVGAGVLATATALAIRAWRRVEVDDTAAEDRAGAAAPARPVRTLTTASGGA